MEPFLTGSRAGFFWCLAGRIVPASRSLSEDQRRECLRLAEAAIADRPASMRRQLALFLAVLRWSPLLRFGAPLDRLSPERQDRVLRWFQDSPVTLIRKGFWGVKALVFMGFYGRPESWAEIHYAPSKSGNERLHGRA